VTQEYNEILEKLTAKHKAATEKRAELEIEINDLDTEIANLNAAITRVLQNMGMAFMPNIAELGITDAVRQVVTQRMTANDVREKLQAAGFKLTAYSNPMASIYKILERLKDQGFLEIEREGRWKVSYKPKPIKINLPFAQKMKNFNNAVKKK
jgi:hypothetical protein